VKDYIHAMKQVLDEYSNNVYKELLEKQQTQIWGLLAGRHVATPDIEQVKSKALVWLHR
jgi:hypothetical protein